MSDTQNPKQNKKKLVFNSNQEFQQADQQAFNNFLGNDQNNFSNPNNYQQQNQQRQQYQPKYKEKYNNYQNNNNNYNNNNYKKNNNYQQKNNQNYNNDNDYNNEDGYNNNNQEDDEDEEYSEKSYSSINSTELQEQIQDMEDLIEEYETGDEITLHIDGMFKFAYVEDIQDFFELNNNEIKQVEIELDYVSDTGDEHKGSATLFTKNKKLAKTLITYHHKFMYVENKKNLIKIDVQPFDYDSEIEEQLNQQVIYKIKTTDNTQKEEKQVQQEEKQEQKIQQVEQKQEQQQQEKQKEQQKEQQKEKEKVQQNQQQKIQNQEQTQKNQEITLEYIESLYKQKSHIKIKQDQITFQQLIEFTDQLDLKDRDKLKIEDLMGFYCSIHACRIDIVLIHYSLLKKNKDIKIEIIRG